MVQSDLDNSVYTAQLLKGDFIQLNTGFIHDFAKVFHEFLYCIVFVFAFVFHSFTANGLSQPCTCDADSLWPYGSYYEIWN